MIKFKFISVFLTLSMFTILLSKPLHATVLYCEVLQSGMIMGNKLSRTPKDGNKFNIKINGQNIQFSDNSPIRGTYKITDTWGGAESGFIANNEDTVINYDEGNFHAAQLNRLIGIAAIFSGFCDKF